MKKLEKILEELSKGSLELSVLGTYSDKLNAGEILNMKIDYDSAIGEAKNKSMGETVKFLELLRTIDNPYHMANAMVAKVRNELRRNGLL